MNTITVKPPEDNAEIEQAINSVMTQQELASLEEQNHKLWERLYTTASEETTEILIGGENSITFLTTKTTAVETAVPETAGTETARVIKPEASQGLIDFDLFTEFMGEKGAKAVDEGIKLVEGYRLAILNLFSEFILVKITKKDEDQQKPKKTAENVPSPSAASIEQKRQTKERAGEISKKLGLNADFEGSVVNGAVRVDLEQALQKADAKQLSQQEKAQKRQKMIAVASSNGRGKRPGQKIDDMNLATEKQSHWSKAIG